MDFFDKMKDGISKGIDTIGAKGKELVEETQTHLQISSLQDRRKKSLEELGALAYAQFQKGALADEGMRPVCETLQSLDQRIAAKQAELKSNEKDQEQPAVTAVVPAAPTALVKCECGADLPDSMKFCSACGKPRG